ncbi:MAG: hypothetical protein NHB32_08370 [Fischerella sp. CENA71]|nr:hypothetical protein [Fischerella sp. CENA71]
MSKTRTAKLWTYITECARLLYWVYFKPYTLKRWLRDIHPELKLDTNVFSKRANFKTNPRLHRYAGQVWWLTALVPWLIVILVAPIYTLISHEAFRWFFSFLFLVGWIIGLMLVAFPQQRLKILLLVVAGFITALTYDSLGVALGVAFGVAFGVALGVASGVAFILGVLRFYFWLPEFLWMLILFFVLSRHRDGGKWLGYLPPRFDEKINLPLPFMDRLIVEAYRENPDAARETIDYLINSTNQQKVAAQAMAGITIDNLKLCHTLGDIAEIPNHLNWIPSPAPKELGNALSQLLDISQDVKAAVTATSSRQSELLNRPN